MNKINRFYVYGYKRSKDSKNGKTGTFYYIGKGAERRAYRKHGKIPIPKDKSNIVIIESNMSENDAFALEIKLITEYGRQNNKTGILINLTCGGEGVSGLIHSSETRQIMSSSKIGVPRTESAKEAIAKGKLGSQWYYNVNTKEQKVFCLGEKIPEDFVAGKHYWGEDGLYVKNKKKSR